MNKKHSPWIQWRRTPAEDEAAIKEFLAKGGKVVKLKDGEDSRYDERLSQIEKRLGGGFNPFSKEDALTVKE